MTLKKEFKVKDNPYWDEQIIDWFSFHIDEKKDMLVTVTIEKI